MAALFHDTILDAALTAIKGTRTLHICSGEPTSLANVTSTSLANVALTSGDFSANADHTTSGRQTVVSAKSGVSVTASGTPARYCIVDGTNLLAKTDVQSGGPDLTALSTVNIPAVTFSIADPSVV